MRQLVFIHGGETFATYEDYLDALRRWEYDPAPVRAEKWKDTLAGALGDGWQVLMPAMPSKYHAKYTEWRIWFDKVVPHLTDGALLVGHSLGGIFLAKYLSETPLAVRISATFLVAAIHDEESETGSIADFTLPDSLAGLQQQGGRIFLYHSQDDPVVPFAELAKYQAQLPGAVARTFDDRGHFFGSEFPKLLDDIRAVVKGAA